MVRVVTVESLDAMLMCRQYVDVAHLSARNVANPAGASRARTHHERVQTDSDADTSYFSLHTRGNAGQMQAKMQAKHRITSNQRQATC